MWTCVWMSTLWLPPSSAPKLYLFQPLTFHYHIVHRLRLSIYLQIIHKFYLPAPLLGPLWSKLFPSRPRNHPHHSSSPFLCPYPHICSWKGTTLLSLHHRSAPGTSPSYSLLLMQKPCNLLLSLKAADQGLTGPPWPSADSLSSFCPTHGLAIQRPSFLGPVHAKVSQTAFLQMSAQL